MSSGKCPSNICGKWPYKEQRSKLILERPEEGCGRGVRQSAAMPYSGRRDNARPVISQLLFEHQKGNRFWRFITFDGSPMEDQIVQSG
jgi:hypothetical protein